MTRSSAHLPETGHHAVIKPSSGWGSLELSELWRYRELIWFLAWRNIVGRYRQMALGPLWIVIQPITNVVVYSLVLGGLAGLPSEGVPYPLFTYSGLLPWALFAAAATGASGSLVGQMGVISKVYFPRLVIPVSAVLNGVVDFAVSFLLLLGLMLHYGIAPRPSMVAIPVFLLLGTATALAIGLWTATLAVKFRDTLLMLSRGVQVLMYASPVAYSSQLVAEQWQWIYRLNPMYWVIEGFRWSLLGIGTPPGPGMIVPAAAVLVALVMGAYVFRRTERTIVDLL